MAKLENLRPSIYDLDDDELVTFTALYRERRLVQLNEEQVIAKMPDSDNTFKREKKIRQLRIMLTEEEKGMALALGISFKMMLQLKQKKAEADA